MHKLLRLLLLGAQVVGNNLQHVGGDLELGADNSLRSGDDAVAARLLVLIVVRAEEVVPTLASDAQREVSNLDDLALYGRCVLLDDGEALFNLAEPIVGQAVGALDVWCDVAVGLGQVGDNGLAEAVVGCGAEIQRLLAIRVRLVGADEIRDDGVGGQMLRLER